jgi:hypothetical protein
VVLSSLAIYNFLSHEPAKTDAEATHDNAANGDATDKHEAAPTDKHSADAKHDAPAKDKSH